MVMLLASLAASQCAAPGMFGTLMQVTPVVSGLHSPFSEARAVVVRSQRQWDSLAEELSLTLEARKELATLQGPLHGMDWGSEMLVLASGGLRSSGGFEVSWVRVTTSPNSESWKLTARLTTPGPDEMVTMAMTTPWAVYRMRELTGEPSFFLEARTRD